MDRGPRVSQVARWEQLLIHAVLVLSRSRHGPAGYGRPRGILHVFRLVERILGRLHPTRALRRRGVVRYEIIALPRAPLPLPGRPLVRRGERVISLHFDNRAIALQAASTPDSRRLAWYIGRTGRADLAVLADLARRGAFPPGVRALWTETLFYPALARYGFTVRPAGGGLRTPFARLFLFSLIAIYGRPDAAIAALQRSRPLTLGEAWMSLDELRKRFGTFAMADEDPWVHGSPPSMKGPAFTPGRAWSGSAIESDAKKGQSA